MMASQDDYDVDDLALEAGMILNSAVFKTVFDTIQRRNIEVLLAADVNSLTASTAHASMKVLEQMRGEFNSLITDSKMKRNKR